jgi:hypothetical protein
MHQLIASPYPDGHMVVGPGRAGNKGSEVLLGERDRAGRVLY